MSQTRSWWPVIRSQREFWLILTPIFDTSRCPHLSDWLAAQTYLMAGFALSLSPDPAAFATSWAMAPGIVYANSPLPTVINPTSGTSQYLVSAHGNPPAVLTYPGVTQTAILPVFAANFQFTPVVPFLTRIEVITNTVVINLTNLTVGVTNHVEKSTDLRSWQPLQNFVPGTTATNLTVDPIGGTAAFYRIRVGP